MQTSVRWMVLMVAIVIGMFSAPVFAQKYELHPYAGGQWMTNYKVLDFKNPGLFGLKGGMAVSENVMIEGNAGYMNQFNFRDYSYRTHAFLYEVAGTYNFSRANVRGIMPYAVFGLGGLTINMMSKVNDDNHDNAVYAIPLETPVYDNGPIPRTLEAFVLKSGDTFFNFSYGGGVKGQRLWGPMGLRADLRGRTMPNFYKARVSAFELTGGLLFSWGER